MSVNWKWVEGYEGIYKVSFFGEVKRIWNNGKENTKKQSNVNNSNIKRVCLSKNGTAKTKLVHRLVAQAFIKNPKNHPHVLHKNGVKDDNIATNLKWASREEFLKKFKYSTKNNGRRVVKFNKRGEAVKYYKTITNAAKDNGFIRNTLGKRIRGDIEGLVAPDGFIYCFNTNKAIRKTKRRIIEEIN